jgi:transcriptional regulator with XRE-family HTH domain
VAAAAGISKPYLSQLEASKRISNSEVLRALAQALNVTVDDLIV